MTQKVKRTPKVRKDGRCYVCKGPRSIPDALQKGVPASEYIEDPFCSANCSRKYWGTELLTTSPTTSVA